jgi:polygalacturonase
MKRILTILLATLLLIPVSAKDIDLKKSGARADGKTKITKVLQKAIDEVSAAGGGRVILSGGTFLTGPVELKSGVELFIDADAVFLGSPDLEDYPDRKETRHFDGQSVPRWRNIALIYADEADNIAITGRGRIDCSGDNFVAPKKDTNWTW